MSSALLPLHLGQLHAYETVLLLLLAFGPFVVLAVVVTFVRRRDLAEEAQGAADEESATPHDDEGRSTPRRSAGSASSATPDRSR